MNKKTQTPNLSSIANDGWDDFNDILSSTTNASDPNATNVAESSTTTPKNNIPGGMENTFLFMDNGLAVPPSQQSVGGANQTPEANQAPNNNNNPFAGNPTAMTSAQEIRATQGDNQNNDHYSKNMLDVLDSVVGFADPNNTNNGEEAPVVEAPVIEPTTQEQADIQQPASTDNSTESVEDTPPANVTEEEINSNERYVAPQMNDVQRVAMDFIKELDLIRLPENVEFNALNTEQINYYKEQTEIAKRNEAVDYLKTQVSHDPYMQDLFEYAYEGRDYADLPRMRQLIDEEINYQALDLSDQEIQRELVGMFLSEDLNPNDAKDSRLLSFIPSQVEQLSKDERLRDEASVAQAYFIDKAMDKQDQERMRVANNIERDYQARLNQERANTQWNKDFRQVLSDSTWSQDRKNAVISESQNYLVGQQGQRVPIWEHKHQMIMNDPTLFQHYLDFVSKLDHNTGNFNGYGVNQSKNESVAEMLQRIANKQEGTGNNNRSVTPQNPNKKTVAPVMNPYKNKPWVF